MFTEFTNVAVEESLAEVAAVAVPAVTVCVVEPVVLVPVVASDLLADAITAEAAIPVVAAPSVSMLEPLPRGTRSRRSGRLKLPEPSPTPKDVPITAKSLA